VFKDGSPDIGNICPMYVYGEAKVRQKAAKVAIFGRTFKDSARQY
jgi:hypothetical protein